MPKSLLTGRLRSTGRALASVKGYKDLIADIAVLLDQARRGAARSINAILTATYWEIGRRIVEHEQGGATRAEYGEELLQLLADDLTSKHGRGFSRQGLQRMRAFYQGWEICSTPSGELGTIPICSTPSSKSRNAIIHTPSGKSSIAQTPPAQLKDKEKIQTLSGKLPSEICQTPSGKSSPAIIPAAFPLSWSHYTRLLSVQKPHARAFYESEALRGGWSVR